MEENKEALNEVVEVETTNTESPAVESNNSEEVIETESTEEVSETETEAPSKKGGANQRIRELANQVREEKQAKESLASQLEALNSQVADSYTPQVEPGSEVTPEQYRADITRTADAIVQLRLKQQENAQRINREAVEVAELFPILNPLKKDEFDPELTESVSIAAQAYLKSNPTASLKKFVSGLMKPYAKAISKEVGIQTQTLAKQVNESATRPTSTKQEANFADLSIEEMEKRLGKVYT